MPRPAPFRRGPCTVLICSLTRAISLLNAAISISLASISRLQLTDSRIVDRAARATAGDSRCWTRRRLRLVRPFFVCWHLPLVKSSRTCLAHRPAGHGAVCTSGPIFLVLLQQQIQLRFQRLARRAPLPPACSSFAECSRVCCSIGCSLAIAACCPSRSGSAIAICNRSWLARLIWLPMLLSLLLQRLQLAHVRIDLIRQMAVVLASGTPASLISISSSSFFAASTLSLMNCVVA